MTSQEITLRERVRRRGWRSALRSVARRLLFRLRGRRPPEVLRVHPFDAAHGVETSGLIDGVVLPGGHPHDRFSTAYFGVPPSRFAAALRRWMATPGVGAGGDPEADPTLAAWTFVDLGCGKGRALLLASALDFHAVHGVELNRELVTVAERNLLAWQRAGLQHCPVEVFCADAVAAIRTLPAGPLLLYLYNPFEAPVLRALLQALLHRGAAAPVDVLYLFPAQEPVFAEFPAFRLLWRETIPLAPEEADGLSAPEDPCSLYRLGTL